MNPFRRISPGGLRYLLLGLVFVLIAGAFNAGILTERLASHARSHPASSTCIARALLLTTPPSLAIGEITDKGSINQRVVLSARATLVERLYEEPPMPPVIDIARENAP